MSSGVRYAPEIHDAPQRESALRPEISFLVQAPAGSGKTELLIQRYLKLLARVEEPESIVAITFTRKAAGEMKQRLLAALAAADGEVPEAEHQRLTWTLAQDVLQRDAALGWQLRQNPARLRIQTIDSLCSRLTRQMPWLARLGASPEPTEDAEPLYREAARETIRLVESDDDWAEPVADLLRHLDNDVGRAEELLAGMLSRRDQWRDAAFSEGGPGRREALEQALQNISADHLALLAELVPEDEKHSIVTLLRHAADCLNDSGKAIYACRNITDFPGCELDRLGHWHGIAELLLTNDSGWRKRLTVNEGFSDKTRKKQCMDLIERLAPREDLRLALERMRVLPPTAYSDEQWQTVESLFDTLKMATAQLRMVFRTRGEVDFIEVAQAAWEALENSTSLALSLDARIAHLLVDEFQDTSISQYRLLEQLTTDWQPGDGRTLFLVGDPMQSIYRFRKAEVGLFHRAQRQGIGSISLEFLQLSSNFRATPELVSWVNETFPQVFPERPDAGSGAVGYSPSRAAKPSAEWSAVVTHAFCPLEVEAEAEQIVSVLQAAKRNWPGSSAAILVRAKSHLRAIVPALKNAGLSFQAVGIDPLGKRPVVQDLLALTRALMHLADRISWLALLRAPWCGLTLRDLHTIAEADLNAAIWDNLRQPLSISADGAQRLARFRGVLEEAFLGQGRMPLHRWIEQTWLALGGPACVDGDGAMADAADYFDLVRRCAAGGTTADLDEITRLAEALNARPDPTGDKSLQLMSIHKAKGLEFDTVIVPGLGRRAGRDGSQLLVCTERTRPSGDDDLLAAPIRAAGQDKDPVYQFLRLLDQEKAGFETGRLLYVAATRARKQLHLFGAVKWDGKKNTLANPPKGSFLQLLWPVVENEFQGVASPEEDEEEIGAREAMMLRRLPAEGVSASVPDGAVFGRTAEWVEETRPTFEWVSDALRHTGSVVHEWLQRIARRGLQGVTAQSIRAERPRHLAALARLGVPADEREREADRVAEALSKTIASERGRWLLFTHAEAQCEYSISGQADDRGVVHAMIDRTFVDEDGVRWIVDYKTSDHLGGGLEAFLDNEQRRHQPQLEQYARLMEHLHEEPIRLGLYFPLLDGWREWSPGHVSFEDHLT